MVCRDCCNLGNASIHRDRSSRRSVASARIFSMDAIDCSRPALADSSSTASARYSRKLRNNDSDSSGCATAARQPCFRDTKEHTRLPLSTLETKKGGNAVEFLVSYQFTKCPLNLGNSFA